MHLNDKIQQLNDYIRSHTAQGEGDGCHDDHPRFPGCYRVHFDIAGYVCRSAPELLYKFSTPVHHRTEIEPCDKTCGLLVKYYDCDSNTTDEFWNSFKIVLVPTDRGCLLHPVLLLMVPQLKVSEISVDMLLKLLEEETINDMEHYKAFTVNECQEEILQDLFPYLNHILW